MRTETITRTIYTIKELREHSEQAFTRAHDEFAANECEWQDRSDEWGSLKALDDHVGYKREARWYHGDGLGDCSELEGRRAWAWLENVVLDPLRLPWGYMSAPGPVGQDRRKHARYKQRPGTIPDCPFTGFYMDEVLLDSLRESLAAGMSVGDAMLGLTAVVQKVCDDELDYLTSAEGFIEKATDLEWEFYASGEKV